MFAALVLLVITLLVNILGAWVLQRASSGMEATIMVVETGAGSSNFKQPDLAELDLRDLDRNLRRPRTLISVGPDDLHHNLDAPGPGAAVRRRHHAGLSRRQGPYLEVLHPTPAGGVRRGWRFRQCHYWNGDHGGPCRLDQRSLRNHGGAVPRGSRPESRIARFVRFSAKVLTGFPSILAGVFAYGQSFCGPGDIPVWRAAWLCRSSCFRRSC